MKLMNTINVQTRKFLDRFIQIERYVCATLLVIMTLITTIQVFFRFILHAPFSWSEEVTLICLVWFGYLCMPIDIYEDGHAAIFAVYNKTKPKLKKTLDIIRHSLLLWLFIELTHYGAILSRLNLRKIQPATGLSYIWLYLPLVVGGILMSIYCVSNLLNAILTPLENYKRRDDSEESFEEQVKHKVEEKGGVL